ncbi:MAG: Rho termination factor N-terminal domain-containing protein [Candidatus Marinimicrobia bacterium]|jgi:DNA polymerase/3'-5' exonuclease PolX|nr:Rho termination factor N-terminal domain-containing protein [Candidatus Neomarinimicrobiota bacterium]HOG75932.1 Rho termination factor N-terminal domain-containing protein [Candidatus Neomarinimicrobiota bacterium]
MTYTYQDLKTKTVAQLREIASQLDSEAVKGYTQLNKEHLLAALCQALQIDQHQHHQIVVQNKTEIKSKIRELKKERDEAIANHDRVKLIRVREQIRSLKHRLHRSMV